MSEKEFEIYLSVLGKLLRLSSAQKAAISDELRDHMEQRLEELLRSGVGREDAIRKAMDEFGDVTGLAIDLTRVSRTPIRTVLFRSTIVASAVAMMIVGWVTLFVPEHRLAAPVPIQAQQIAKPNQTPANPPEATEDVATAKQSQPIAVHDELLFPAFLANKTDVNFVDMPLTEVCQFLSTMHDVPVTLEKQALMDEGIDLQTPITLTLNGLTFEEVLNHISRMRSLAWYIDDGIVAVTTKTASYEHFVTLNWDLSRLIQLGHSHASLVAAIQFAAFQWHHTDGEGGTLASIGQLAVIRQNYQDQRRISQLLTAIERQQPMAILGTCSDRDQLLEKLRQPASVESSETPLSEVLKSLATDLNVTILIDATSLSEESINPDDSVSLTIKKRPLGKVLDLLLRERGLTYLIRDGVICVMTQTRADEDQNLVVYCVREFMSNVDTLAQFANAIQVATNGTWSQRDGEGGALVQLDASGTLVVKQTDRVHAEIRAVIDQLRRSGVDSFAPGASNPHEPPKLEMRGFRLPKDVAADLVKVLPTLVSPDRWSTGNGEAPMIELVACGPRMEEIEGLVSGGIDEVRVVTTTKEKSEPAKSEQAAPAVSSHTTKSFVARPRSLLVIRQTPEVHREIMAFLMRLDVPIEPVFVGGVGRGGFGGMGGGMGGMGGGGMGGGFF